MTDLLARPSGRQPDHDGVSECAACAIVCADLDRAAGWWVTTGRLIEATGWTRKTVIRHLTQLLAVGAVRRRVVNSPNGEKMWARSTTVEPQTPDPLTRFTMNLRPDLIVRFDLPADLTADEAGRLGAFIAAQVVESS